MLLMILSSPVQSSPVIVDGHQSANLTLLFIPKHSHIIIITICFHFKANDNDIHVSAPPPTSSLPPHAIMSLLNADIAQKNYIKFIVENMRIGSQTSRVDPEL